VADANDYNLLVHHLKSLMEMTVTLHEEVERRRQQGPRERLEPNRTAWVHLMNAQLVFISGLAKSLERGTEAVLRSQPGVPVFDEPRPDAPDSV
jgi:hypothetical protein